MTMLNGLNWIVEGVREYEVGQSPAPIRTCSKVSRLLVDGECNTERLLLPISSSTSKRWSFVELEIRFRSRESLWRSWLIYFGIRPGRLEGTSFCDTFGPTSR